MNFLKNIITVLLLVITPSIAFAAFNPAVTYTAGTSPRAIAMGDFNGDSKLDIAVVNSRSSNVSVLLGNSDGTFNAATNFTVGTSPRDIVVGDYNGDSKLDIVAANVGGTISVLLGTGTGSFGLASNFAVPGPSVGTTLSVISTADFNGDGFLDIVADTGAGSINNLAVLLGVGDGTFGAGATYSAPNPNAVTTGDFNGDGNQDFASSNGTGSVSVFLGAANGTFSAPRAYNLGAGISPSYIDAGDYNGDNILDLIVPSQGLLPNERFKVLRGGGGGTFSLIPPVVSILGNAVTADYRTAKNVIAADFNGDQALDSIYVWNNVSVNIFDTVAPTGTIVINNNDLYTTAANVRLTLSCNDGSGSGCSQMQLSTDNANWSAKVAVATRSSISLPFATDGTKTVYARFFDKSGNTSLVASDSITYDTTAPNAPIMSSPSVGAYSTTTSMAHDLAGSAEPRSTVSIYYYSYSKLYSIPIGTTIAANDGSWSFATTGKKLQEELNPFFVTATDNAQNTSLATQRDYIVDTLPPRFDKFYSLEYILNAKGTLTTPPVGFNTRTASDIYPVTVTTDAPNAYPIGSTTVTWVATDIHGNTSTSSTVVWMREVTPIPTAPIPDTGPSSSSSGCLTSTGNGLSLILILAMLALVRANRSRDRY